MIQDILFIIIIFLSNIIQTVTGFAGTVLAMPFSLELVGENPAKSVLNLVAMIVCLYIFIFHFKDIDWKHFLTIFLFVGLGFAAGYLVEMIPMEHKILLYVYASLIILIAIAFFFLDFSKVSLPKWLMLLFLFLGGIMHKLFVSGGPFVVVYAIHEIKDKNAFRATLSPLWLILNTILFVNHYLSGYFVMHTLILLSIGAGVTVISLILGALIAPKLSKNLFMKITCVLLLLSGVTLLIR